MDKLVVRPVLMFVVVVAAFFLSSRAAGASDAAQIARGRYLVAVIGCGDCHTPGSLLGKPDTARFLGGSDVGFGIPGMGVFVPSNLTPDKETGLGQWTLRQIVAALTTGKRPDGRVLAPIMPWQDFARLKRSDAFAIAAYLKSLKAVRHAVPGPFGPNEKVSVFVMQPLPPDVYNDLPGPAPKRTTP